MANTKALTKVERLYRILKDGKRHSALALVARVGHRFGAAIFELRDMGFDIVTDMTDRYNPTYQLRGEVQGWVWQIGRRTNIIGKHGSYTVRAA